jgi:hypothetical protein
MVSDQGTAGAKPAGGAAPAAGTTLRITASGYLAGEDMERNAEVIITLALTFCAEPETFPVFCRWFGSLLAGNGDLAEITDWLAEISPSVLHDMAAAFTEVRDGG